MAYTLLDAQKFHEVVPLVTSKQNFISAGRDPSTPLTLRSGFRQRGPFDYAQGHARLSPQL